MRGPRRRPHRKPTSCGRARRKASPDRDCSRRVARMAGSVRAFCEHVRRDHRLELGDTLIATILFQHGARSPARRGSRSRDQEALRGSFETFFPGAQWVGDGKQLGVVLDGKTFPMNLELVVRSRPSPHREWSLDCSQPAARAVAAAGRAVAPCTIAPHLAQACPPFSHGR